MLLPLHMYGQKPIAIERLSKISLELAKKERMKFALLLDSADVVNISLNCGKSLNFRVYDPLDQIIYESTVKTKRIEWDQNIDTGGIYSIELESKALFFPTEVNMTISLTRPEFVYGDTAADSLVAERRERMLTDGNFPVTKSNPKTYLFTFKKGDTLHFELKPISGKSPLVEIKNDLNELVFASLPQKEDINEFIPILNSASYIISLRSKGFFGKSAGLKIRNITPDRYIARDSVDIAKLDSLKKIPSFQYDTIPEIFMDTVIYLGGIRDILNENKRKLSFQFEDPYSIGYWGILFGAGKEFLNEFQEFELSSGGADLLTAYGMGNLKNLPGTGNEHITFTPSEFIRWNLKPPLKPNYALISYAKGSHYLSFENASKSVGQNVYVKIVLFRKIEVDQE